MSNLSKYNEFLLEKQFQYIIDDILEIVESNGEWVDDNTYEWNIKNDNISDFLSKLSKENIKKYFYKLIDKIKLLPYNIRNKLIINYASIFLTFVSIGFLIPENESNSISNDIREEILSKYSKNKSSFDNAQSIIKAVEGGYSDDKDDSGNWIKVKGGKRFIGTNHGISAPILGEYLDRLPTKSDMENLSYETALKIYKKNYWDEQNLSEFTDQSIANIIYDGLVNQGKNGMKKILRKSLIENGVNIKDTDNPFDKRWINKANRLDQSSLFSSIKKLRKDKYKDSITFKRHGEGWLNRLNSFKYKT